VPSSQIASPTPTI